MAEGGIGEDTRAYFEWLSTPPTHIISLTLIREYNKQHSCRYYRATNSQQTGYGIVIFHINYEISTCSRIFICNLQKTVDDNYTSHKIKCHLRTVKLAKQTHKDFVNCKSKDELSSSHPLYLHIFYNPN